MEAYNALCEQANQDYAGYWGGLARDLLTWHKPFTQVFDDSNAPFFKWLRDGELNVSYNCIDRHLAQSADKVALIFEADGGEVENITYAELHRRVCQFANGLKSLGVVKGDRVVIYMPMVAEAIVAMQACAHRRHPFRGVRRLLRRRRERPHRRRRRQAGDHRQRRPARRQDRAAKATMDEALAMDGTASVQKVVVYQRTPTQVAWTEGRDVCWTEELTKDQPVSYEPEWMNAEDHCSSCTLRLHRQAQGHSA
ncbi:MAG: acetyl-coenzyme A synthetase N-terminal domain-containing protein [Rivihabitans pingtungensis]